ncbi:MAG: DUF3598 family protein [Chitinophagaceae bacterium]|nr:DUF3598 family protein [Chitinophagaceae bacterium]
MELRLFPKHTGIWEGTYTRIDAAGNKIDQWKSRLTIRMFDGNKYHQVNQYFWPDGYEECHDFGVCTFNEKGELIFDNERIQGKAWETGDSVVLVWTYKNRPGSKLFEMIDLIGEGHHRIRTWKWSEGDIFQGNTMIEERRVAFENEIPETFWEELPYKRTKGPSRSDH